MLHAFYTHVTRTEISNKMHAYTQTRVKTPVNVWICSALHVKLASILRINVQEEKEIDKE